MKNRETFYGKLAPLYESFYPKRDYEKELVELVTQFKKYKVTTVIDLGCGTGTHAKLLANKGYLITGIDNSREMLSVAKRNNQSNGNHFVFGNMRHFCLPAKQDACYSIFSTILYNTTNSDILHTFESVKKNLKPNGLFIIRFTTPLNTNIKKKVIHGNNCKILKVESFDVAKQVSTATNSYFIGEKKVGQDVSIKRLLFPEETKLFLQQAGFRVIKTNINKQNKGYLLITIIAKRHRVG